MTAVVAYTQTVATNFDSAVSVGDSNEVTRCCQLMSVLGNSRQGLERYGKYVSQLLTQYVDEQRTRFASEDGRAEAGVYWPLPLRCEALAVADMLLVAGCSESAVFSVCQRCFVVEAGGDTC